MTKPGIALALAMDDTVEDEKKPFDALGAQNDEDSQPDLDEHLMLESGHSRAWLVKVCKHYSFDMLLSLWRRWRQTCLQIGHGQSEYGESNHHC